MGKGYFLSKVDPEYASVRSNSGYEHSWVLTLIEAHKLISKYMTQKLIFDVGELAFKEILSHISLLPKAIQPYLFTF